MSKCRFVWFKQFLGHAQIAHRDGSVTAWFHDSIGGPGSIFFAFGRGSGSLRGLDSAA